MTELKLDLPSLYPDLRRESDYDYSILVDTMAVGSFACESYGAAIRSRKSGERAEVPHITVSIPRIDELMERLVRNQVSPAHLRDVVEDWL